MTAAEQITQWTSDFPRFYFFLPDGPYGRPLDNQYSLESVTGDEDKLLIVLSDNIVFELFGSCRCRVEDRQLSIVGFGRLTFKDSRGVRTYSGGEVSFVGD